MSNNTEQARQTALNRIIATSSRVSKDMSFYVATLGAATITILGANAALPPLVSTFATGLVIELMGGFIDRVASKGDAINDEEIIREMENILQQTNLENERTRQQLRSDMAKLAGGTNLRGVVRTIIYAIEKNQLETARRLITLFEQQDTIINNQELISHEIKAVHHDVGFANEQLQKLMEIVSASAALITSTLEIAAVSEERVPARPRIPIEQLFSQPLEWILIAAGEVKLIERYFEDSYLKRNSSQVLSIDAFEISKYPVTNAQYAEFIIDEGYTTQEYWTLKGWEERQKHQWQAPRLWFDGITRKQGNYPVAGVSWYEAIAFANWVKLRTEESITLPDERQWQRAAQGDDEKYRYPWGNKWNSANCNHGIGGISRQLTPVNQFPTATSQHGVMDMVGNVSEWCITNYDTSSSDPIGDFRRVLRGGSYLEYHRELYEVTCRYKDVPQNAPHHYGFRLVRLIDKAS